MAADAASYRELFFSLAGEYNRLLGAQGALQMDDGPQVEFQTCRADVRFVLRHSNTQNPSCVAVECRLGGLPADGQPEAMMRLLQVQRTLTVFASATLSLDPTDGEVCHTLVVPLVGTGGMDLHRAMTGQESIAGAWRSSHFENAFDEGREQVACSVSTTQQVLLQ